MARGIHQEGDESARVAALITSLVRDGVLAPLGDDLAEAQLWMDCDLCSCIENRFHESVEPASLSDTSRASWSSRALAKDECLEDPRDRRDQAAFWICDRGNRVGTIALATSTLGATLVRIFSLYVFRAHRGAGIAERALRRINDAAISVGYSGIRLATHWTSQRALRFYLFKLKMWAWSFKRSIEFVWSRALPEYVIDIEEGVARFALEQCDGRELIVARRDGQRLLWTEAPEMTARGGSDWSTHVHARSTLAVALALHGWPLVRSRAELDDSLGCDLGGPEVLAYKIAVFESLDRSSGFEVRAPRIPGLPYDEIERRLRSH